MDDSNNSVTAGARGERALRGAQRPANLTRRPRTESRPARGWHQINGIPGSYAPEAGQGYIRIEKVSGENPFLAYGVVNDGGVPGERSGDGAYLPAREQVFP